jgi:hypothetical protein
VGRLQDQKKAEKLFGADSNVKIVKYNLFDSEYDPAHSAYCAIVRLVRSWELSHSWCRPSAIHVPFCTRSIASVIGGADAVVSALGYSGFNLGALDIKYHDVCAPRVGI